MRTSTFTKVPFASLEPVTAIQALVTDHAARSHSSPMDEMTPEERRERRRLRREKQREDNVKRAAKMHVARRKLDAKTAAALPELKQSVHVGCSGWRYLDPVTSENPSCRGPRRRASGG